MVLRARMVEVRSNPPSQGGRRCLGSLGTVCKLANLACGWTGTTGGAPRSERLWLFHYLESDCNYCVLAMHKCTNARAVRHGIRSLGFMHHQGRTHICLALRFALLRPRFLSGVA